jgi:two-component system, sensor histidine kinase SagS
MLLIGPAPPALAGVVEHAEITPAASPTDAADQLRSGQFDGIVASATLMKELIDRFLRDEIILGNIDYGIATLDLDGRVTWGNPVLRGWCGKSPLGLTLLEALDFASAPNATLIMASDVSRPLTTAANGQPVHFRIHRQEPAAQAYLDARIRPAFAADGTVVQLIAILQNVTAEVEQQRKLNALHTAGRELAALEPSLLVEMNMATRVEMLKKNIRKHVHDLLRYETIEVRVLDRRTGELKPLLEDGMTEAAASRPLFARPEGYGVTGHVAFTGKSYHCEDTSNDPYYIEGAAGAKSSLTVPIKYLEDVVGTLNVESPRPNGFGPEDMQFTELFSKEIGAALNTLDLLTAQQSCAYSESIEAVNKEIALPIDEVLANAALLQARLRATDPIAADQLHFIMRNARLLKSSIQTIRTSMADPKSLSTEANPLTGKRVLVVEQQEHFRKQAHLMLGRLGASVETVSTAAGGLALLNDTTYDAVLQEIRPVDMGGYDAFRRFRVAMPMSRVAFTTGFGYDSQHSIVRARQDGLRDVIFKPFRAEQVVKAVNAPEPPRPNDNPIPSSDH